MGQCTSTEKVIQTDNPMLHKSDTVITQSETDRSITSSLPTNSSSQNNIVNVAASSTDKSTVNSENVSNATVGINNSNVYNGTNMVIIPNIAPLHTLNPDQISNLPFKGQTIEAYVCQVYDGDTCTVLYYIGTHVMKINIRIADIDAPEVVVKLKDKAQIRQPIHDLEQSAGAKVRDFVRPLIEQKYLYVNIIKHDKYGGRVICHVYLEDKQTTISQLLLQRKYVKYYKGQKKELWTEQELNYILHN